MIRMTPPQKVVTPFASYLVSATSEVMKEQGEFLVLQLYTLRQLWIVACFF